MKKRVYISDHGTFTLFGMHVSLPAILELEEEQIAFINNSGSYNVRELSAQQTVQAKETPLSRAEGDRFSTARTISVNELAFKMPILGVKHSGKAKDIEVVDSNSILAKRINNKKKAISSASRFLASVRNSNNSKKPDNIDNKNSNTKKSPAPVVSNKVEDKTIKGIVKDVANASNNITKAPDLPATNNNSK